MASFNYKAKNPAGGIVTGRFDAADRQMVISLLRNKGLYPIDIDEVKVLNREISLRSLKAVSTKDLAVFCRQFSTMINAGVTVLGSLDMLRRQTSNPKLADVLNKVYDDVQKGKSMSESMAAYSTAFPVILRSMLEVGEVSGTLDSVLERLAVHFEKDNKMRAKIKTAMMYPATIGCIAFVVVLGMLLFIVPNFVSMFNSFGAELPRPTQILLGVSNGLKNPWVLLSLALGISLLSYFFSKFKRTEKGKGMIDAFVMRLPIIGKNMRKILASRFTRTLSSLLNTGVPLIQALDVVEKVVNNHIVGKGLAKVREEIRRGSGLAGPLEQVGIFPVMVTQMISVGEESGALDSIMGKVADFYDDEVDTAISQMISLLEPLMIALLAVVIGSIVVAMILPVFSMYGNIK